MYVACHLSKKYFSGYYYCYTLRIRLLATCMALQFKSMQQTNQLTHAYTCIIRHAYNIIIYAANQPVKSYLQKLIVCMHNADSQLMQVAIQQPFTNLVRLASYIATYYTVYPPLTIIYIQPTSNCYSYVYSKLGSVALLARVLISVLMAIYVYVSPRG